MRRRDWCTGALALASLSCRQKPDTTVSPDELPPAPERPAVPPDAFAIEGHGARLALRRPVHVQPPVAEGGAVHILSEADGRRTLKLHPGVPPEGKTGVVASVDGAWIESADEALTLDELGELTATGYDGDWRIVIADAACEWPDELDVEAFGGELPRVELRRFAELRDVMVVVRGPARAEDIPPIDGLVAPGQEIVATHPEATPPWIELTYGYDGETWTQRHYRVEIGARVLLVTAQATAELAEVIFADVQTVAGSLRATAPA